jgi:hypothetical protein
MTARIRAIATDHETDAMVAADSHPALAERIERMLTAGRGMALAIREFTYTGRPPVIYAGLRLHDRGLAISAKDDQVTCAASLTNGDGYDGTRWFGYSVRAHEYSGNETEAEAWQRYRDHKAESDSYFERRRDMTHIGFVGGLSGWRWQTVDRIVVTEWNGDGVATEWTLGFEPGDGTW